MRKFFLAIVILAAWGVSFAHAADTVNTLSAWTSIWDEVVKTAAAIVLSVVGSLIAKYVKDVNMRGAMQAALTMAAGKMADHGQQYGDQFLQNTAIKNAALAKALNYLADQVPQAIKYFGLSSADLIEKVQNALALHFNLATPTPANSNAAPVVVSVPATAENAADTAVLVATPAKDAAPLPAAA